MADDREQREREERDQETKSRVRVVDRRMLSEDERTGKSAPSTNETTASAPKLEMVGASTQAQGVDPNSVPDIDEGMDEPLLEPDLDPQQPAAIDEPEDENVYPISAAGDDDMADDMSDEPMSDEEIEQVRLEMEAVEAEQFAALEQRVGRPLTEQEKASVRAEMERQAQSMTSLEVAPMLQQLMAEMSARAAVHMGLMPNPYTRLIARNDSQARLAIDAFGAMHEVLKPHLDPASGREYARVLNDLRVNFSSLTGAPPTGPSPLGQSPLGGPSRIIR